MSLLVRQHHFTNIGKKFGKAIRPKPCSENTKLFQCKEDE